MSEWITDKGKWYYIAGDGYMVSDAWIGDYYVGSDGSMLTDTITPDGYYVGADRVWIKGRQAEVQDNQYLDAYAAFLRAYKIPKGSSLKPQFHLLYIDGDAIPELVIALDGCHAASADLYCYAHGSVQHLGSFGDFGKFSYVQGANLFCDTQDYNGGGSKRHYHTIQNNTSVSLIDFSISSDWTGSKPDYYYYINSIPVTADIYNSQKAVWEAAYIPVSYAGCGQGHSLNETNIEKMLENIQNVMPKKSN